MNITFLGTGTSHGVPTIDCTIASKRHHAACVCAKAHSNPRYKRTRCSLLISLDSHTILIDVSLDFREQMLAHTVRSIDTVLITHAHADHIGGMPDIRSYTHDATHPLPVYGSFETLTRVKETFGYIFDPATFVGGGIPYLSLNPIHAPFLINSFKITPIPVTHGNLLGCYGFRINGLVYIPDLKSMTEESYLLCKGADVLIINCMRIEREHVSHLIVSESLALARKIGAKQTFFTHMSHEVDFSIHSALLDQSMAFAYDGLTFSL